MMLALVQSADQNRLVETGKPVRVVHASMLAWRDKGQLQPTRVAANAPMRSVLMQSSLEAEFRSHFLLRDNVVPIVYKLRQKS